MLEGETVKSVANGTVTFTLKLGKTALSHFCGDKRFRLRIEPDFQGECLPSLAILSPPFRGLTKVHRKKTTVVVANPTGLRPTRASSCPATEIKPPPPSPRAFYPITDDPKSSSPPSSPEDNARQASPQLFAQPCTGHSFPSPALPSPTASHSGWWTEMICGLTDSSPQSSSVDEQLTELRELLQHETRARLQSMELLSEQRLQIQALEAEVEGLKRRRKS